MYTRRNVSWKIIMLYGWKSLLFFVFYSAAIVAAHHFLDWHFLQIPFLPISAIGIAVAFYVGFKNIHRTTGFGKVGVYGVHW
jgi:putative membrane protein